MGSLFRGSPVSMDSTITEGCPAMLPCFLILAFDHGVVALCYGP